MSIKKELQQIIKNSIEKNNIEARLEDIIIETPRDKNNGDYSTNIALVLAKKRCINSMNLAIKIKDNINNAIIEKIEIANSGFINIYLTKEKLQNEISKIIQEGKNYGRSNIGKNQKINIEYVSAPATRALHIEYGRDAAYGDNLSRILDFTGYEVTREYYINDTENHKLSSSTDFFKNEGLYVLLNKIKTDLDKFRVSFDIFTSEQSLYDTGLVENVLNTLGKTKECYVSENALWLKTTNYGDEKDRVIVKNDGSYTYLLPDIAYHINKIERGYDKIIDVLGANYHGYINRLKGPIEILGYNSEILDVRILQMIRILKDGEQINKPNNESIPLIDIIEEFGVNATRFLLASKSSNTPINFDISLAVKNSNKNPIYYIEYANARISKILNSYKKEIILQKEYKTLTEPLIYTILNKLMKFEDIIILAAEKKQPHIICNYVYELSRLFHSYYTKEKIITDDEEYTKERMSFLKAIKIVINNSLNLLGIIPREEM